MTVLRDVPGTFAGAVPIGATPVHVPASAVTCNWYGDATFEAPRRPLILT